MKPANSKYSGLKRKALFLVVPGLMTTSVWANYVGMNGEVFDGSPPAPPAAPSIGGMGGGGGFSSPSPVDTSGRDYSNSPDGYYRPPIGSTAPVTFWAPNGTPYTVGPSGAITTSSGDVYLGGSNGYVDSGGNTITPSRDASGNFNGTFTSSRDGVLFAPRSSFSPSTDGSASSSNSSSSTGGSENSNDSSVSSNSDSNDMVELTVGERVGDRVELLDNQKKLIGYKLDSGTVLTAVNDPKSGKFEYYFGSDKYKYTPVVNPGTQETTFRKIPSIKFVPLSP